MHPNLCIAKLALRARALAGRVVQGGLTPRKLALTLCLGTAVGVMPLLWGTTILCALCAVKLKLNQGAVQAVNYFCYPLQLALLLPFCRLGEFLFPWGPAVKGEILSGALHGNIGASLSLLAWATARGVGAWLVTAAPLALLAYPMLRGALCRKGVCCRH